MGSAPSYHTTVEIVLYWLMNFICSSLCVFSPHFYLVAYIIIVKFTMCLLRIQAGSSSPVSSISGFSTNSHMDDGGEDSSGKGDDKRTGADPFTSTHTGSDPFAAFSLPPDDPFAVNRGGGAAFKPSDLSAFDPFGTSDPFKVIVLDLCTCI